MFDEFKYIAKNSIDVVLQQDYDISPMELENFKVKMQEASPHLTEIDADAT